MKRPPTDAELAILQVLWREGPCTVRRVHEALGPEGAYTTTLKMLQIMHEKGLVHRDEAQRSHVYRAAVDEAKTQSTLVESLLDKAFAGSATKLVMRALSLKRASKSEVQELQRLLDEYRRKGRS
jgi:predicted transcriptional regulator